MNVRRPALAIRTAPTTKMTKMTPKMTPPAVSYSKKKMDESHGVVVLVAFGGRDHIHPSAIPVFWVRIPSRLRARWTVRATTAYPSIASWITILEFAGRRPARSTRKVSSSLSVGLPDGPNSSSVVLSSSPSNTSRAVSIGLPPPSP